MGKRKKESEAHKRKRENREKIIVNLELQCKDRLNKWVKLDQIIGVKSKCSEEKYSQFQKILTKLRLQQNKENKEVYANSEEFFRFLPTRTQRDVQFLKQYPKMKVVSMGPNQFDMILQLEGGEELSYYTGKKLILKNDTSHIHVVKVVDQDNKLVEFQSGTTDGTDINEFDKVLDGLLVGSDAGLKLFDEVISHWG